MLTYAQAAEKLNVCVKTLRRIIADGRIRPVKITLGRNGTRRIRPADLDAFIAKAISEPTKPKKRKL